jgi:hypothetical protein
MDEDRTFDLLTVIPGGAEQGMAANQHLCLVCESQSSILEHLTDPTGRRSEEGN